MKKSHPIEANIQFSGLFGDEARIILMRRLRKVRGLIKNLSVMEAGR